MVIWRNFGPLYASQTLPRPKVRACGCQITSPRDGLAMHGAFGAKAKLCAPRFLHKAGTWGFVQATQASQRQAGKLGSGAGR